MSAKQQGTWPRPLLSPFTADYLVVAGGGAGSATSAGGGGGAGGMRFSFCNSCAAGIAFTAGTTYAITVGAGGSNAVGTGTAGTNSVLNYAGCATITSTGGGRGGISHSDGPGGLINGGS
jgi:hypothetical protein